VVCAERVEVNDALDADPAGSGTALADAERASAARLLEALTESLRSDAIGSENLRHALLALAVRCEDGVLDLRTGNRADDLDRLAHEVRELPAWLSMVPPVVTRP